MIEQLSKCLEWHESTTANDKQDLPENGERVLAYLAEAQWFTMVTFISDEAGSSFVCHCTMDHGRPTAGTMIDVGEKEVYWARLSPEIALATWVTEA